jgi:ATP-dependent DNA helicase RecG
MDLKYLKGVGPAREKLLARLGIHTLEELLEWYPREYQSRPRVALGQLPGLEERLVQVQGRLQGSISHRRVRKGLEIISGSLTDGQAYCQCTWFNQGYLKNLLQGNQPLTLVGKVSQRYGSFVADETHLGLVELPELQPLHNLTAGLTHSAMNKIISASLNHCPEDPFSQEFREQFQLLGLEESLREIHFPTGKQLEQARERLKFQELFFHHVAAQLRRRERHQSHGTSLAAPTDLAHRLEEVLGFAFTPGQLNVIREIGEDLAQVSPMLRLVQGDVGCGKTAVAIYALLVAALNGQKGVMMAPTEILARQHAQVVGKIAQRFGVETVLLTAAMRAAERRDALAKLAAPGPLVALGTHALFQEQVAITDLVVAITDEQHRFGVKQRLALAEKGLSPHILVMSATPIPRTLAMSIYGDMEVSTIPEKPAGRIPVHTHVVGPGRRERVFAFICKEMAAGKRGYIVCPLIDESEAIAAKSLAEYRQILTQFMPAWVKVGELHGRMSGEEKAAVVAGLKAGDYHVLLATTVVEVGIDIGNATFILVENAERYGLAQLHQLRGRVGRNQEQGWCILIAEGPETQRLKIMETVSDGFEIAREDLKLRGPGQLFGKLQHGINEFKLADIINDAQTNEKARRAAQQCLDEKRWASLLARAKIFADKARG